MINSKIAREELLKDIREQQKLLLELKEKRSNIRGVMSSLLGAGMMDDYHILKDFDNIVRKIVGE